MLFEAFDASIDVILKLSFEGAFGEILKCHF